MKSPLSLRRNQRGDGGATLAIVLLLLGVCLSGCASTKPRAQTPNLPPACVALAEDMFRHERRPSLGGRELTDQEAARLIADAGRVIRRYEQRLDDLSEVERSRLESECLAARG